MQSQRRENGLDTTKSVRVYRRNSPAISHLPGMIYVKLLNALSICDTCPAFLVMNSSYEASHFGGSDRIWPAEGRGVLTAGFGSEKEADMAFNLEGCSRGSLDRLNGYLFVGESPTGHIASFRFREC